MNTNLYFVSILQLFCLFPLYIKRNPNLYFGSNPSFLCLFPSSAFKQIQICTSAQSHDFSVDFVYVYVSKSKSVLCLNPITFLLISFIHRKKSKSVLWPIIFLSNSSVYIQWNPNLYFSKPCECFCSFPLNKDKCKSKSVLWL